MPSSITYPALPTSTGSTTAQATVLIRQLGDFVRETHPNVVSLTTQWGYTTAMFPKFPFTLKKGSEGTWKFYVRNDLTGANVRYSGILGIETSPITVPFKGTYPDGTSFNIMLTGSVVWCGLWVPGASTIFTASGDTPTFTSKAVLILKDPDGGGILASNDVWQFAGWLDRFVYGQVAAAAPTLDNLHALLGGINLPL